MTRSTMHLRMLAFTATVALTATWLWAGSGPGVFDLTWHRIAGGGETFSTGGNLSLGATIGQHEAGEMAGGDFTLTGGFWAGADATDSDPDPDPPCPADLTGSGTVGVPDLLALLGCWGPIAPGSGCENADLSPPGGSGTVGVPDLLNLLGQWGPCPE